ncbi:MAG: N-acetylneuraminate synthase family protein [Nitrospiraceae bacterium]
MSFCTSFRIDAREVGDGAPVFIIAEGGLSHFGDMELARQLVNLAADGGADAFKTQFFDVEALIARRAQDWRERLRPRNLTFVQARELKNLCSRRGLIFLATAHDETRIRWLQDLDVPAVKVGSGERNNPAFLSKLASIGKPMIVSTGMYGESDVREAIEACAVAGCQELALLHCVTSYPTPSDQVNLAAMGRLKQIFPGPVGYSDHTEDNLAVLAAVARGAAIIEKHITILRNVPNAQDWKVSAGPENFAQLVSDIRRVKEMIGHGRKEPAPCEREGTKWALKSLVPSTDLPAGHKLVAEDLCSKRPGDGIPPNQLQQILGCQLKRNVQADELIVIDDIASAN